ncbi:MAG: cysteine synthase family protein [Pseudomonadota bacterium]
MLFNNALDMIGNTPLIHLAKVFPGAGRIYGKAEFVQPGGSVKDRAALKIISGAHERGELEQGQPVVEMTSGNMGAGLAVVCNVFGNPFTAVMSEGNSPARVTMLEGVGANVVLVPQVDGAPGKVTGKDIAAATERAKSLNAEVGGYYVDQFNNPASTRAHYSSTGPEIWRDLDGKVSAFVAAAGSGGTFTGTSQFLKEQDASVFCAAVEPEGSRILAGEPVTKPQHLLQGTGYGIPLPHWHSELVDDYLAVTDDEAVEYRDRLARLEGLYVGYSAAANVCAAIKLIESGKLGENPVVVTILCDTGLKY